MTDSSKTRRRSATYTLDVLASKMFPDRRFSTAPTSPIAPPVGSSPRPQLDRLARSLPDASDIVDELIARDIRLNLGGSIHDPTDPVGDCCSTSSPWSPNSNSDLIRMRTREGMKIAKARGRLRGKQPKLSAKQEKHLVLLHAADEHTTTELAELFNIDRSAVYPALERSHRPTGQPLRALPCVLGQLREYGASWIRPLREGALSDR